MTQLGEFMNALQLSKDSNQTITDPKVDGRRCNSIKQVINSVVSRIPKVVEFFLPRRAIEKEDTIKSMTINQLPLEVVEHVFSYLQPSEIGKNFRINSHWRRAANELLKREIYEKVAFNKKQWEKFFGKEIFKGYDDAEDFKKLPKDIVKILYSGSPFFKKKRVIDVDWLVWIPETINGKPLTLKVIGELVKEYFPTTEEGYRCIVDQLLEEGNDKPITKSHWLLMTGELIPDSTNKSFADQKELISKAGGPYEMPNIVKAVICIFAAHLKSGRKEYPFGRNPWSYICCQEKINGQQVIVGGFYDSGLDVADRDDVSSSLGTTAQREIE